MKKTQRKKTAKPTCQKQELGELIKMILSGIDSLEADNAYLLNTGSIEEDDIPSCQGRDITSIKRGLNAIKAAYSPLATPETALIPAEQIQPITKKKACYAKADDLLVLCPAMSRLLKEGAIKGVLSRQRQTLVKALSRLIGEISLDSSEVSQNAREVAIAAQSCLPQISTKKSALVAPEFEPSGNHETSSSDEDMTCCNYPSSGIHEPHNMLNHTQTVSMGADKSNRWADNVAGRFYIDMKCIDCDLCRETAPAFFTRNDEGGYSFVFKQPTTSEEIALCDEALAGCPVESIGHDGD